MKTSARRRTARVTAASAPAPFPGPGLRVALATLALLAVGVAWLPSIRVPFLLDDQVAILDNDSIRHGPFAAAAWRPPGDGNTVQGRPVLNASFAASQLLAGDEPAAHRAVNLVIHLLNAVLLTALLALLLQSPRWGPEMGARAFPLALLVATLWALHPLQTLSVTYVAQRAESLASLFYLGTLTAWFAARRFERLRVPLLALSVASCALGMLTKEIVVTAPLAVLVLDRALHSGKAPRLEAPFALALAGLAATFGLLLWMLVENDFARGSSTGTATITIPQYLLTQAYAIPLYLGRILWPSGILFDHGERLVTEPGLLAAAATGWLAVLAGFAALLQRRRFALAAVLALFFVLLSPTSSVVPVASQTIAEHRVYLASAIVIGAVVVAGERWARGAGHGRLFAGAGVLACVVLAGLTFQLNRRFQDPVRVWEDVVARAPGNWRGFANLAGAHAQRGDDRAAIAALDRSLALAPTQAKSHYNRANARRRLGDGPGAEADYRRTLDLEPGHAEARNNLAMLLKQQGDTAAARRELEDLVQRAPGHASAWYNLALLRFEAGDDEASRTAIEAFLALRGDSAKGWLHAGDARLRLGDAAGAREAWEQALRFGADRALVMARLRRLEPPEAAGGAQGG